MGNARTPGLRNDEGRTGRVDPGARVGSRKGLARSLVRDSLRNGFLPLDVHAVDGDHLVSTYEVLSQLTLPNLKKIAKRLGIHVKQGLSGFIAGQAGLEIRRPYIQALANSNLVTVQEIDRILGTRYSKLSEDTAGRDEH